MKLTKKILEQIIKEELETVLNESTEQMRFREIGKQDAKSFSGMPTKEMVEKRMSELNIPDIFKYDYFNAFLDNLPDSEYDHLEKDYPVGPHDNEIDHSDLDPLLEKNKK